MKDHFRFYVLTYDGKGNKERLCAMEPHGRLERFRLKKGLYYMHNKEK